MVHSDARSLKQMVLEVLLEGQSIHFHGMCPAHLRGLAARDLHLLETGILTHGRTYQRHPMENHAEAMKQIAQWTQPSEIAGQTIGDVGSLQ